MLSSPDTLRVFLNGLELDLRIHGSWPATLCLIVDVLAAQVKFLEPLGYRTVTDCAFNFRTNVFTCLRDIIAQLVNY